MPSPRVEFHQDHLAICLEGVQRVEAMRRALVVPYATIENAEVGAPGWPGLTTIRVGTHVPQIVACGAFHDNAQWKFLDIRRETKQALTLHLKDHAEFDEVTLDVPEPGQLLDEVAKHARIAPPIPHVLE